MRMEDVDERRAYVQRVRQSFDAPGRQYGFEKSPAVKEEGADDFLFVKIRFLIAALLFAAYVFCDQTGTLIYRYSAKQVAETIAENYEYDQAKEEVMQVFKRLN